jgi:tRNA-splicing endonuclease subunit Sen2
MKQSLNQLYGSPLPLNVRPLPPIFPHNPISWLWFLYEYLAPAASARIICNGILEDGVVKVTDETDMGTLWSMGFFGKGTLSRSEPSWYIRTARRLGLEGGDKITSEDITAARRQERKKFKQERAMAEQGELERRRQIDAGEHVSSPPSSCLQMNNPVELPTNGTAELELGENSVSIQVNRRPEDDLIVKDSRVVQQEFLQLMPCEALFLSYGLGVLQIEQNGKILSSADMLRAFSSCERFLIDYVVYHHYRSQGWCVRSGVKFGTDFLLYRRGPPFSHAEFAVMIMKSPECEQKHWWWNTSVGRTIGGVKKTLVFCYVEGPDEIDLTNPDLNIKEMLKLFTIREVVYRRWIPAKNRD